MVRGLGGIFIYASNAAALVEWYSQHFGLEFQYEPEERSYYRDFLLPLDPQYGREEHEVFAIRQADAPQADSRRRFVINLRVHDLGRLVESGLKVDRRQDYPYGRFARLKDLEGNELELFEAAAGSSG